MLIYFVLLALLIVCCILETYADWLKIGVVSIRTKYVSVIICGTFFMAMGIMRSEKLGKDAFNYFNNYWLRSECFDWKYYLTAFDIDNGFYLINKIIHLITDDYWLFRAILFAVLLSVVLYIFCVQSRNVAVSLLVFFGLFYMDYMFNGLRQGTALVLCFLAYHLYVSKKRLLAFMVISGSITIHKTACIFLLAFLLVVWIRRIVYFYEMIIYPVVFLMIAEPVVDYLAMHYKSYEIYGRKNGGFHLLLLILTEVFMIRFLIGKHDVDKKECAIAYNLVFISVFSQIGALYLSIFTRVNFYFTFFMCLLIPDIISSLKFNKSKSFYLFIVVFWFGALMIYSCLDSPYIVQKF